MSTQDQRTREQTDLTDLRDASGRLKRPVAAFRSFISTEPGAAFSPQKDRYVLYINRGCPWAARANLVRSLKGLEDIIQLVEVGPLGPNGWEFDSSRGSAEIDPLYGYRYLRELYFKAKPDYTGRYTVPVLWDKQNETVVSNESSEIIRMFYSEFDEFIPAEFRESQKVNGEILPNDKRNEIDEMNEWVYDRINNGVYKCGFAQNQEVYEEAVVALFDALDRVEGILSKSSGPFILGQHLTKADIRLYPTIARFDVSYYTLFKCNLRMIRHDYPHIHKWYQNLYWDETTMSCGAFKKTTYFDWIKDGYASIGNLKTKIVPLGPVPDVLPKGQGVQPGLTVELK